VATGRSTATNTSNLLGKYTIAAASIGGLFHIKVKLAVSPNGTFGHRSDERRCPLLGGQSGNPVSLVVWPIECLRPLDQRKTDIGELTKILEQTPEITQLEVT
jgi:hypothetical protein